MSFINNQDQDSINYYNKLLRILGSLSNLFSNSNVPYISYRVSENLFCKAFEAQNLSRSDVSADASKDNIGVGIKTFVEKTSSQKVAEFNKLRPMYAGISDPLELARTISGYRNDRINFTKRNHSLEDLVYHCIVRDKGIIKYYDTSFPLININNIKDVKATQKNTITFNDDLEEYSFNLSKSTLYKKFKTPSNARELPIEIIKDPFKALEDLIGSNLSLLSTERNESKPFIYLPLYSLEHGKKVVYENSGLNQWHALGRERNSNEIYLPYPAFLRNKFPNFFPSIEEPFELLLPNGETLSAKVCQENGKAIMSNPNRALGKWLLRDVLNITEGELLTYTMLEKLGVDAVLITKEGDRKYSINFASLGKYENFLESVQ